MDLELHERAIAITGGTDGLGLALASRLLGEGGRVAVCGRNSDRLEAARDQWSEFGANALVVQADVTSAEDASRFISTALDRWGHLDGLVNNAAKSSAHTFETIPEQEWYDDFDLKVHAAVRLTRLALPALRAAGGGSIINVLNTAAKTPGPRSLPTTASRAAGLAITKALSKELGPDRIRVNAVMIGLIESGQWRRRAEAANQPLDELYVQMAAGIPLGRVGTGDEFADLASFLLSPRASYISGTAINLDGGAGSAW